MVIGGGKTKALRNQRRRQRRNAAGRSKPPAPPSGKLGNFLRRIFAPGERRKGK